MWPQAKFFIISVPSSELYQGMWDHNANEEDEMSFKRGQILHIISKVNIQIYVTRR